MQLLNIRKIVEGVYNVDSLPCPECMETFTTAIEAAQLFRAHQGAKALEVFPDKNPDIWERFMTGYCTPCWDKIFPDE